MIQAQLRHLIVLSVPLRPKLTDSYLSQISLRGDEGANVKAGPSGCDGLAEKCGCLGSRHTSPDRSPRDGVIGA